MLLLVQLDLSKMNATSYKSFLTDFVATCKKHGIDGIVLRQTKFDDDAKLALKLLKEIDKTDSLIIVSEGREISTGKEVIDRL